MVGGAQVGRLAPLPSLGADQSGIAVEASAGHGLTPIGRDRGRAGAAWGWHIKAQIEPFVAPHDFGRADQHQPLTGQAHAAPIEPPAIIQPGFG